MAQTIIEKPLVFTEKLNTPIELFEKTSQVSLYIKREDKTFASFGTKLRKFSGLLKYLQKNQIRKVLTYGNPHSNYLAAFNYLLQFNHIEVTSIFHTKDAKLKTANSILAKRYCREYFDVHERDLVQRTIERITDKDPEIFVLSEFALHNSVLHGLHTLWEEIVYPFQYIFMDLGSGATALSAMQYYQNSNKKLVGVCIGSKINVMDSFLDITALKLEMDFFDLQPIQLISPLAAPGFARSNKTLENFIKETWNIKAIPTEPIYSAKSLYTILDYLISHNIKGDCLYIHQGGLLNHTRFFQ